MEIREGQFQSVLRSKGQAGGWSWSGMKDKEKKSYQDMIFGKAISSVYSEGHVQKLLEVKS